MTKQEFVRNRRPAWRRFHELVSLLDRISFRKLPPEEITEYSRLMRELAHDLAAIRSHNWGAELDEYLNQLLSRGHNSFYRAPPFRLHAVAEFLAAGYPRMFRRNFGYVLAAAVLFFGPGAISWLAIQNDPALANRIIPDELLASFDQMYGPAAPASSGENAEHLLESFTGGRTLMMGFYVRNNVGIALECFARGILLGIGTVYTLLYNGIFIGAVGGYVTSQGHGDRFLSFIISHGAFELTAICVAGGGGLVLGDSILHPGRRTWTEALKVRGLEAVQLAAGAAVMLVLAAMIEAYWSPTAISVTIKYSVGAGLWVLVGLYLALVGRNA